MTTDREVRYLVDAYYLWQDDRKRSFAQTREAEAAGEPSEVIGWLAAQAKGLERELVKRLEEYTDGHPVGVWLKSVDGIGLVLAAGLLAHIEIERCPTVGHIWQFAGIAGDGQKAWEKGKKRPFNA